MARAGQRNFKVLVVDDDVQLADDVSENLCERGFRVATCYSIVEAMAEIFLNPPDILITDFRMGPLHGGLIIKWIRAKKIPTSCILMSGWDLNPDERKNISDAMTIQKPFAPEALNDLISRLELPAAPLLPPLRIPL